MDHSYIDNSISRNKSLLVLRVNFRSILIYLFALSIFTPYIYSYYLIIPCAIGLLFIFLTLPSFGSEMNRDPLVLSAIALTAVVFLYRVIGISDAAWGNYGHYFLTFISVWMGIYIRKYSSKESIFKLFIFIILLLAINVISNIRLYNLYPNMNAVLKGTEAFEARYGRTNIGTTNFKYCVFFSALILLSVLISDRNKQFKRSLRILFWAALILLLYFTIVYSTTGTIILCTLLGFPLIVIFGTQRTKKAKIVSLFILFALFMVFIIFFNGIMDRLIDLSEVISGEKVSRRMLAIKNVVTGSASTMDIGIFERFSFILMDIRVFFSSFFNFLIGNGYHTYSGANTLASALANGDGGHSGLFDLIARYGVIGLILVVALVKRTRIYLKNTITNSSINEIVFILLLFNNIFNDMFDPGVLFIVFAMTPMFGIADYE